MDMQAVGTRIRLMREARGLTQEALAELVNITAPHMSVIERGVKQPRLDTFVAIANALKVPADILLQDVVEKSFESKTNILSERIGRLPKDEQMTILEVVDLLTGKQKEVR